MAHYMVQGPDGAKHMIEGPDDATPEQVESFAASSIGPVDPKNAPTEGYYDKFAAGPAQTTQPTDAGDARAFTLSKRAADADAQVAQEAKDHPVGRAIDDTILSVLRGTPFGSWTDEMSAGMSGAANSLSGGKIGQSYEDAKAYEDARLRALDANSTTLGHIGPLPVTTEGLKELGGGILSAPLTPVAKLFKGASLLPRMGNHAVTGGILGGIYGAGNEEGGRLNNAKTGAEIGATIGGVVPPASDALGNLASGVTKMFSGLPSELKGFAKGAIERIAPAFEADGVRVSPTRGALLSNGPHTTPQSIVGPGQEGMLLDYGPSLQAHGAGLVNSNTPARTTIVNALEARKAGAKGRIESDVNSALGQPVNLPQFTEQAAQAAQARAKPLYDQFRAALIQPTPELNSIVKRAANAGAVSQAQKIMATEGVDPRILSKWVDNPMTPITGQQTRQSTRVPHGAELDYIKRGIDSLTDQAQRAGDKNMVRIYSNLARELRNETDRILSPNDPSQSIWAQARQVAGDDIRNANALEYGQDVFKKGLSKDQLAQDLAAMSPAERAHARVGAREDVRGIMANSGTSFGDNGDSAARRVLGNDEARAKLAQVAGAKPAKTLVDRLDTESLFERTRQPLLNNSRTALNTEARKLYPAAEKDAGSVHNITLEGMAFGPIKKIADMLMLGAITEKNVRIATDAAKMLVAQGADRDAIAKGLKAYLNNKGLSTKARVAITRVANTIAYGARGVAVNSATTPERPAARP